MKLTDFEKAMLNGEYGKGKALAMKIQVAVGEAFGAEKMVEISRAHVALSNQEADLWFAEKLVKGGAKCIVQPTVNPAFDLEYFQKYSNISEEDEKIIKRTRNAYRELGAVLTYSCTPYHGNNVPRFGEITAYSESSATPYINSVYGARTNREAAQSALCAAITGRVPEYGLLLDENRAGDVLVKVEADINDAFDYQLLGYCAPKIFKYGVPVFTSMPKNPNPAELMNFGAQLNTGGAVGMFHIVGVTPEATTLNDAFHGKKPKREVVIKNKDLADIHNLISDEAGKIDFALFGCPHFTINQIKEVSDIIVGKKLKVELWIMTSSINRTLAKRMGYLDIIEKSGGHIVSDTCMDQPCWHHLFGKKGITDSPKCAYYTKRRNMEFVIRRLSDCVNAALKGEIE